jgi:tripartite-type tricarboxylate transporter receptor subunit TctC
MVNPYAPGGAVDVVARPFAQKLTESLGQTVIIDNRPGAGANIGTEMVVRASPVLHVPYKGGAPAINALIGGEVQMTMLPVTMVVPQARGGRVRALAVTSAKRIEQMPELPTVSESGIPEFDPIGWYAFLAPAGTPRPVIMRLNTDIRRILQQPDARERFIANGMFPAGGSPEVLRDHLRSEIARWRTVIKQAGSKPE